MFSGKKILVIIGIVLLLLAAAAFVVFKLLVSKAGPATLTYWGLWEPNSAMQVAIDDYKRVKPNVTINYQKMSPINYRERLTAAIASETGPDIVRIHNSWLPMLKNSLQPIPSSVYSAETFKNTFYGVASDDLVSGGQVWAVPLEIDTILMYVNEDLLTKSGGTVPTTWEDFSPVVSQMTVRSGGGLQTSGTALGGASNVDHWQEVVGLMMLQAGVDLNSAGNSTAAQEAMGFYTGFITAYQTWDETQDASTLAFANGKVGFYFGPSWRFFDIKEISSNNSNNSDLNFKVYPVPQLQGSLVAGRPVNYATYWAEAVSKKSKNGQEAAEFLKFISSKEELSKLYSAEAKLRGFGEPYSRVDLGESLKSDPVAGVVISQAPTARSWYLASVTNDGETGINSKIGKYYTDAINSIIGQSGQSDVAKALETVAAGVSQVLGSYGVTSSIR